MRTLLAATLLISATTSTAAAAQWRTLTSKEGNFKLKMPGKPQTMNRSLKTAVGKIEMHIFVVAPTGQKAAYMLMYNDYPEQFARQADPKKVLDGAIHGVVRKRKGKITQEKDIKIDGYPGKAVVFESGSGGAKFTGHIRTFLVKNRLYQVMVLYDRSGAPTKTEIARFLTSFERLSK